MPYISQQDREEINQGREPESAGELNYKITTLIQSYLDRTCVKGVSYGKINEVIGALECCKLELYRRLAAPYEDKKMQENGDVY